MKNGEFSIQKAYELIHPLKEKVVWRSIMLDNNASKKSKFILWIIARQRLPTLNTLAKWGLLEVTTCALFGQQEEDHQHLFMDCPWSREMKSLVLGRFNLQECSNLEDEVLRVSRLCKRGKHFKKLYAMVWTKAIYEVWLQLCQVV